MTFQVATARLATANLMKREWMEPSLIETDLDDLLIGKTESEPFFRKVKLEQIETKAEA